MTPDIFLDLFTLWIDSMLLKQVHVCLYLESVLFCKVRCHCEANWPIESQLCIFWRGWFGPSAQ